MTFTSALTATAAVSELCGAICEYYTHYFEEKFDFYPRHPRLHSPWCTQLDWREIIKSEKPPAAAHTECH